MRLVEQFLVDAIEVAPGRRATDTETVRRLAESMREIGLRTPITVRIVDDYLCADGERADGVPVLVTGRNRLAAARELGWEYIECFLFDEGDGSGDDERTAKLWEISENLDRAELTPRQRTASTKAQIIARAEKAKQLRDQGKTHAEIAEELGVTDRTVREDLSREAEENAVITQETSAPRKVTGYRITQYTQPATAARRIREVFREEFAEQLARELAP